MGRRTQAPSVPVGVAEELGSGGEETSHANSKEICLVWSVLLCSEDELKRGDAVEKIMKVRDEGDETTQLGDNEVRPRKTPLDNTEATSLSELLDWTTSGI